MPKINQKEYNILKGLEDIWKWIARDNKGYSTKLKAHASRPYKMIDLHWSSGDIMLQLLEGESLFQFVQWEDEEPYNIRELIEEHEKESEETGVKKDIEWATEEIKGLETEPSQNYPHDEMIEKETVLGILNQLDEPEVLSQELPVIPQFVSDWIEASKHAMYHLLGAVYDGVYSEDMKEWLFKGDKRTRQYNQDKLTRAWLYGYTVEEEPKYNVEIKSSFGTVGIFLFKQGDEVLSGDNFKAYYPKEDKFRLTEQEIRGFQNGDILFEHFAVKVEELEE